MDNDSYGSAERRAKNVAIHPTMRCLPRYRSWITRAIAHRPHNVHLGRSPIFTTSIYLAGACPLAGVLPFISTTDGTMNRERILRFGLMIFQTSGLPQEALVDIVKAKKRYSSHFRAAALRNLICDAPLSVTGGQPFAERRRRVRRHYGV
ncbi:hypothetical protein [Paraburkholderia sp. RL17-337-BIB-A]|uniref:hypothetical protein n=1 Tax=Paraburkholderia sp. RL17-337-BIB-A TaxID=3031636 RepID=UPI0038BC9439